jgi:hypothetical protein
VGVVVVTNEQDLGADHVVLELERRGVAVLRCNAEQLPEWHVLLRPGEAWNLRDARGREAASASTTGLWWRRPEPPLFKGSVSSGERQALVEQWHSFAEGLASVPGPRWISVPSAIAAAEDKAQQIAVARRLGFAVPDTIWTNDLALARSVATGNHVVVKTVTAAHWGNDHESAFVFAHTLDADDLPRDPASFAAAPAALQERVEPKRDVRVTVVGAAVMAAEASPTEHLDWRLADAVTWTWHDVPRNVAERCRELVAELGLGFGGIDLALDRDGTYWFLEINPNGEWAWLQAFGLPIAAALADALIHADA